MGPVKWSIGYIPTSYRGTEQVQFCDGVRHPSVSGPAGRNITSTGNTNGGSSPEVGNPGGFGFSAEERESKPFVNVKPAANITTLMEELHLISEARCFTQSENKNIYANVFISWMARGRKARSSCLHN